MKPSSCHGCPVNHQSSGFCNSQISSHYGVALVGEALGSDEVAAGGLPFQGKAGKVFDRLIERTLDPLTGAPLLRSGFTISNSIFCQPQGNELAGMPYELGAIQHCRPNLDQVLSQTKPKAILAMGRTALYRLTTLGREKNSGIEYWRGSVIESPYGWVIPTFHPSYIMRGNFKYAQVFINDLLRALDVARNGVPPNQVTYLKDPPLHTLNEFIAEWENQGKSTLAFDIETNYSGGEDEAELEEIHLEETKSYEITRLSLAHRPGQAITVPWLEPYKSVCQALLSRAPKTCVWNEPFDVPRLQADGVNFTGDIFDAMTAWHLLMPSVPYGLQFASSIIHGSSYKAWKNEGSIDFQRYSCKDSDALLINWQYIEAKLKAEAKWDTFLRHFVQVGAILRKMSKHGVLVDSEKRSLARKKFALQLEGVKSSVQPLIPLELKPKKLYKITKEQIEKKFKLPPLETLPSWLTLSIPLTESEKKKLAEKSLKLLLKQQQREAKLEAQAQKKSLRASAKLIAAKGGGKRRRIGGTATGISIPDAGLPSKNGERGDSGQ